MFNNELPEIALAPRKAARAPAAHAVKLVDAATGKDVEGGSVNVATAGGTHGEFRYAPLAAPIKLNANTSYLLVTQEIEGGDPWCDYNCSLATGKDAQLNGPVWGDSKGAWQPSDLPGACFGPVDFKYTIGIDSVVPTTFVTEKTLGDFRNNLTGWVGLKFTVGPKPLAVSALGRIVVEPRDHPFNQAGRFFIVAENRCAMVRMGGVGNISADNGPQPGKGATVTGELKDNLSVTGKILRVAAEMNVGTQSSQPPVPPVFPEPVLDGRKFYRAQLPDCGFQSALDELGKRGGGTLRIPGGVYALKQSLTLPSKVTLAGYGVGTILAPARDFQGPLISATSTRDITVRELTLKGEYQATALRGAALAFDKVENARLIEIDVRGWEGEGIVVKSGKNVFVQNCRAMQCRKEGFHLSAQHLRCVTSLATGCGTGFRINGLGSQIRIDANIAGDNAGDGFLLEDIDQARVVANNACYNRRSGMHIRSCRKSSIVANSIMSNNLDAGEHPGLLVSGASSHNQLLYNNCGDQQGQPTQVVGILEDTSCANNEIRANVSCTLYPSRFQTDLPSLSSKGKGTVCQDNVTKRPGGASK